MKSDASTPIVPPTYTRITVDGRTFVALGTWSRDEMLRVIAERSCEPTGTRAVENVTDGYLNSEGQGT